MKTRLYKLTPWLVKMLIPKGYKGSYVLYFKKHEIVEPFYVGRSDTDLRRRLLSHPYLETADYFEYFVFDSCEKAYLSETALYHNFEFSLLNEIHPAMPAHSFLKCPFCNESFHDMLKKRVNLIS